MSTELQHDNNSVKLENFINEIEAQKTILSKFTNLFTTLSDHFTSLTNTLTSKSQSLDSKLQALDSSSRQTLNSLDERESSIPHQEAEAVIRVEEQKQAALAEFDRPSSRNEELSETLKSISRKMDSSMLLRFIVLKRKESVSLRAMITSAIQEAVDPPRLVLDALEEFMDSKRVGKVGVTDKRWACGMLVQALFPDVKSRGEGVGGMAVFATSVVERAGRIVDKWKEEVGVDGGNVSGLGPAEVVIILHLVVGFGLKDKFDKEFLRKVVLEFASRRDMAKLAAALGFGDEMKDIIDELLKTGKEIEAVYFTSESGLTEQFPPVSLLKSYLRNSKKNAPAIVKNDNTEESNNREIYSIKSIIRCVEDHKLESEFPLDSLRRRVTQFEKSRAERKNKSGASKPTKKRGKSGSGSSVRAPSARPSKVTKFSNAYSTSNQRNTTRSVQHSPATRYSGSYNYHGQSPYEFHTSTPYGSTYGRTGTQSPVVAPRQPYQHHVDPVGSSGAYGTQTNYVVYDYSSVPPPSYPASSYMQ